MTRRDAGFTLVELLAAMVAAALLLTALGSITAGLNTTVQRQDVAQTHADDRPGRIMTLFVHRAQPSVAEGILAEPHHLRFPIQSPEALPIATPLLADLTIIPRGKGSVLIAQLYEGAGSLPIPQSRIEAVQAGGMMRFDTETSAEDTADARLISVTLHIPARGGATRSVTATPRITAAAGCQYDPISMRCRQ